MRYHSTPQSGILDIKSHIYILVLFLLLVHALGTLRSLHAGLDQQRKEITDAQILETPDTVFVFVQVDNVVDHNGLGSALMSRHPTTRIESQSLFTIDEKGNSSETSIVFSEDEAGPSLHPVFTRVFAFKGSMFLMRFNTPPGRPTLYKWQKDRFVRVSHEDAGDLAKTMSSIQKVSLLADANNILDELTKASGWKFIETSDLISYKSNKYNLVIKLKYDDRKHSLPFVRCVVAESLSTKKPWAKTLIEIDPQKKKVVKEKTKDEKK